MAWVPYEVTVERLCDLLDGQFPKFVPVRPRDEAGGCIHHVFLYHKESETLTLRGNNMKNVTEIEPVWWQSYRGVTVGLSTFPQCSRSLLCSDPRTRKVERIYKAK